MAKQFPALEAPHLKLIDESPIFLVGSAADEGRVNISPKGTDSLRVLSPSRILWMNITGSGNETAGHLLRNPRMTLMWCSFTTRPMILRAYGTARAIHRDEMGWDGLAAHFPPHRSARQIFDMAVDLVQTSCGYSVPFMDYTGERDTMDKWVAAKSDQQIREYWQERNRATIDGMPTGMPE